MLKRLWFKLANTIIGGAILIAVFSILSRLLGLLRDRLLASHFGAGSLLDSYYAAFKLPDLVFNTLVLGALASAFIPVFSKVWHENKAQAIYLSSSLLNYLLVFIAGISLAMFFLAPVLVPLIAPGFSPELLPLTVQFTRIMLFSLIFFFFCNIILGIFY